MIRTLLDEGAGTTMLSVRNPTDLFSKEDTDLFCKLFSPTNLREQLMAKEVGVKTNNLGIKFTHHNFSHSVANK